MKILVAPAHYLIDPRTGSEYTRAYEYLSQLATDFDISGDVLAGYSTHNKIGHLKVHTLWSRPPQHISFMQKIQFLLWTTYKGLTLMFRNHYDTLWHLGPFSLGETFNILGILNHNKHFVIGPIYTPFQPRTFTKVVQKYLNIIFYPLSYFTIRSSNLVITIEKKGEALLARYHPKKSMILPLSISPQDFLTPQRTKIRESVNLLTVSHLVARKRVTDIIEAIAILNNKKNKYKLTIVGDGPERQSLEKQVQKLKLKSVVTFVGAVDRTVVHKYYQSADLFISASLEESMAGVYFEAMASSLPMVLTKNASSQELSQNDFGGILVAVKDPQALAEAVEKLTESSTYYLAASLKNYQLTCKTYNFSKNIHKLKSALAPDNIKEHHKSCFFPKTFVAFLTIIVATILVFSVRGQFGNPDPVSINSRSWKEDGPFELSPERGRYTLTNALVESGKPYFSPAMAKFTTPDLGYSQGHYVSLFAPLLSYLVIPGYYLGKLMQGVQVGTFLNVSFFALINFLLMYRLQYLLIKSRAVSIVSSLIFLFASPAYSYSINLYQHHLTVLLILLGLVIMQKDFSVIKRIFIFFLWTLSVSLDYPNAFLYLPLGIYATSGAVNISKTSNNYKLSINLRYLSLLLGVILPLSFFLWFNNTSYGSPTTMLGSSKIQSVNHLKEDGTPGFVNLQIERSQDSIKEELEARKGKTQSSYFEARDLINGLSIMLFSPDRGVVFFTPVLLIGLFGMGILLQKNKNTGVVAISIIISNFLIYSMWGDPWGGWAFGSRYLIPAYAMLAIFLGAFLDRFRKNILVLIIFLVLAGYSIYVNTAGALSTSANPPKVQVLELEKLSGKRERYSFDRNLEYLVNGSSKSFVYQTWLKDKISAYNYFRIIAGSIAGIVFLLTIAMYFEKEKHAQL